MSHPHSEQDILKALTEIFLHAKTLLQCGAVLLNTRSWAENGKLLPQ